MQEEVKTNLKFKILSLNCLPVGRQEFEVNQFEIKILSVSVF